MDTQITIIDPNAAILNAKARYETLRQLIKEILVEGIDYGTIPNTDKPCLYKAGSEKLCSTFGFDPRFEVLDKIEDFRDEHGLFNYNIKCSLVHISSGLEIATGIGSCNSKESKYRWRWVREDEIPSYLDKKTLRKRNGMITEPEFAIDKAETMGKYGKPAEYWAAFENAMTNGTAIKGSRDKKGGGGTYVTWTIGGDEYRIPNDEIFSLANTIQKMATKRALVAATLIGTNASDLFTQDLDEMSDFSADFIPGKATAVAPSPEKIIVDDEADKKKLAEAEAAAKLKAEVEAAEKAITAEREKLSAELVGQGKRFATTEELGARIKSLGYENYAQMRKSMKFEEVLVNLKVVPDTEPILSSAEPVPAAATNGSKAKK